MCCPGSDILSQHSCHRESDHVILCRNGEDFGFWPKKAVGCWQESIKGYSSRRLAHSRTKSGAGSASLSEGILERKTERVDYRPYHSGDILTKNPASLCPSTKKLPEAKFKSNGRRTCQDCIMLSV